MKKEIRFMLVELILYFIAAFSFFGFINVGFGMVSEVFATGYRLIPAFLAYFLPTYILITYHRLNHAKSLFWKRHHQRIDGAILVSLCVYILVLDISYFALGEYYSILEKTLTPLYPLDTILIALFALGYGIYLVIKSKAEEKKIRFEESKNRKTKFDDSLSYFMKAIGLSFSLYMVGGLLWGLDFGDFDNPKFMNMVPLFLLMLATSLLLGYDIYFESYPIKHFSKTTKYLILGSLTLFVFVGMIGVTITFIAFPNIISEVGQPYFRIDIIGNINIAPYALTLPNAFYCLYLWSISFLKAKKLKEQGR